MSYSGYALRDRGADAKKIQQAVQEAGTTIVTNITNNSIVSEGRELLNTLTSRVETAAGAALSTATAALAKLYYSGTTGNFESALENIECTLTYFDVSEDNSDNIGSPCRKRLVLSSLSGFCQCEGAKVELSCTEVEQQAVETFLNSGVYIE